MITVETGNLRSIERMVHSVQQMELRYMMIRVSAERPTRLLDYSKEGEMSLALA